MNKCKICKSETNRNFYCSNVCKFKDPEYNKKRSIKKIVNDKSKIIECKLCGWVSNDINNLSGSLKRHLKTKHSKKHCKDFFIIKKKKKVQLLSCPKCDWKTKDIENKSGQFTLHIKQKHKLNISQFIKKFPEYKKLWKMYFIRKEREFFINKQKENRIKCALCKEYFKKLSNTHLKKHGLTPEEYKKRFNIIKTTSDTTTKKQKSKSIQRMLNMIFSNSGRIGNVTPLFKKGEYSGVINRKKYEFKCNTCNYEFEDYLDEGHIPICRNCYPKKSFKPNKKSQQEIYSFLKKTEDIIITEDREILKPKEIDFLLPNKNIGIELHGLYWHSEKFKDKNYHLNKLLKCNNKDIRLIQIFEDEWIYKQDIVKNRIKHILNYGASKIHGRKCIIKEIDSKEKNLFLEQYHIQGSDSSSVKLGAFYNDKLVAVMTFGKLRKALGSISENKAWELIRFATNYNYHIIGIGGKLLKYFLKQYIPIKIISYADRRWSNGNFYEKMGFKKISDTLPNYWYIKPGQFKRIHRFNFRKQVLSKKLKKYYPDLTERQNMKANGYLRIWDCGNIKYELKFKS